MAEQLASSYYHLSYLDKSNTVPEFWGGGGGGDVNFGGTNNFSLCHCLCKLCFSNKTELRLAIRQRVYLFEPKISAHKPKFPQHSKKWFLAEILLVFFFITSGLYFM